MSKSVQIITLGCSKNTVDSEKLLKQFKFSGYKLVSALNNHEKPDIVIVNTCGFINDAKEESVNTILELIEAKKRGELGSLYVMGCLSERYMDVLKKEIPEADRYFGVNKPEEILSHLNLSYNKFLEKERILAGPSHYAYLKVSEGCNRNCTFCAIPGIRGRYVSRPHEELVEEAKILAEAGVKELILIAQDLTYYGTDLYKKQMLVSLCKDILKYTDIPWLRLHYLYPGSVSNELLQLMKESPRICNYIDIPVQHISDSVLTAMKRNHSETETRKLLSFIRGYIPEAAIRTTLICGFPGETENDFRTLMDFIREFRFDRLGVFTYSHEEDTSAYINFTDNIPEKVKRERADEIMAVQQEISLQKNMSLVGKQMKVITDRKEGEYFIARSEYDSPEVDQEILIESDKHELYPGDYCNVLIRGATEFDLKASQLP
ncbi:MAG: 30S ribosomal protein S12 methylthiotransferase RimO [Bacteroidales bacterium]|nr:30S ribosomal protein S12 methylthiotransferase RimO [Bacteroidales bacterium]